MWMGLESTMVLGTGSVNVRPQNRSNAWIAPAFLAILVFGVFVVIAVTFENGREARADAKRAVAVLVENENRAFCGGLGFAPPMSTYAQCVAGLSEIRRLQQE